MHVDTASIHEPPASTRTATAADAASSPERSRCVAYIMSRFPKLTETFVLFEMLALEEQGAHVEVFPLLRARNTSTHPEGAGLWTKFMELFRQPASTAVMHPEAADLVARAHFTPLISFAILAAQLHYLVRRPLTYLSVLWTLVRANWGSANFLLGGLTIFPKCVYFARCMERIGVDHVHAHFANHPAAAAYIVGRMSGIPYSFTAHGADLQVDQHMLREKVAAAKGVVAISLDNQRLIESVCGPDAARRVSVIRCGVDTRVFAQAPRDWSSRSTRPLQVVCVGTLYEVKGHTYLIDACQLLRDRQVDVQCHLVGDGPLLDELRQQVTRLQLADHVQFHGRRTRTEIAELLANSDVLVAPSVPTREGRREGIPVVLMEAMASGLPVVASRISGIPELVTDQESGWLVPPRDPEALAEALQTLAGDRQRCAKLGAAGRERVLNEFDLDKNAGRLLKLFFADVSALKEAS